MKKNKEKIKKVTGVVMAAVTVIQSIFALSFTIILTIVLIKQIVSGIVGSIFVVWGIAAAVITTAGIKDYKNEKKRAEDRKAYKEDCYTKYRQVITAVCIKFVYELKLTQREMNKFLSVMRYTERENGWGRYQREDCQDDGSSSELEKDNER